MYYLTWHDNSNDSMCFKQYTFLAKSKAGNLIWSSKFYKYIILKPQILGRAKDGIKVKWELNPLAHAPNWDT